MNVTILLVMFLTRNTIKILHEKKRKVQGRLEMSHFCHEIIIPFDELILYSNIPKERYRGLTYSIRFIISLSTEIVPLTELQPTWRHFYYPIY